MVIPFQSVQAVALKAGEIKGQFGIVDVSLNRLTYFWLPKSSQHLLRSARE